MLVLTISVLYTSRSDVWGAFWTAVTSRRSSRDAAPSSSAVWVAAAANFL